MSASDNAASAETLQDSHVKEALAALTGFIDEPTLLDLASRFSDTYRELAKGSTEHFLVTPVTALPTGKEKGKFLSIDVGGTNLRVGFIELLGELENGNGAKAGQEPVSKIVRSHDKSWPIEEHLKMDQAEDLFAWIGDCIADVVKDALKEAEEAEAGSSPFGEELLLGITFSFPMAQTCLSEATLLPMGKGFAITSDLNLGKMLLAGYARHISSTCENGSASNPSISNKKRRLSRLPRIRIAAITNDTVATFASLAYAVKAAPNSRVAMGLIVGTGTNATVPMPLTALHPAKQQSLAKPDSVSTVVINTEWTIRGTDAPLDALSLKTKWDAELDRNSDAPGFQPFEYMTAGRYLGEIVRLVFIDVVTANLPPSRDAARVIPPSLQTKNALPTRFLSEVVARTDNIEVLALMLELKYPAEPFWTEERARLIRDIAHAVQQRSSALVAAACIGLLACVGDIAMDAQHQQAPSSSTAPASEPANGTTAPENHSVLESNTEAGAVEEHVEQEDLVIAYTGGTISQYPSYLSTCQHWIDVLVAKASALNKGKRVVLREALDGGIVGAGVLAGMTDDIA